MQSGREVRGHYVPLYFSGVGGLYEPPCPKPLGFYEPNRLARMAIQ